jgi:hypothetical protein
MPLDEPSAQRLLSFCSRLPALKGDRQQLEGDARHALACFSRQRVALAGELNDGAAGRDLASLRCEVEALDAARSVITEIWQRRFGEPLSIS